MSCVDVSLESVNRETTSFFAAIIQPNALKTILPLQEIQTRSTNARFKFFWNIIQKKRINCFQLDGSDNKRPWRVYYVDLEIPILFLPTSHDFLPVDKFIRFWNVVKIIKSNLSRDYSQVLESFVIQIKGAEDAQHYNLYTFKLEDQERPKKSWSQINTQKEGHPRKLHTYLGDTTAIHANHENFKQIRLKKGRKRDPFGQFSPKNRLNTLTGREWVRFTKSWYVHRPPPRKKAEILHPAKFPETMIRSYLTFFTRPGELVLDPFLGSGSTLVSAKQCNRSGVGIELSQFYADIAQRRLDAIDSLPHSPSYQTAKKSFWHVILGNAQQLPELWIEHGFPQFDFCITSPPYWNQLARNTIRQQTRKDQGLDTRYSEDDPNDLGNIRDYYQFLEEQRAIFGHVFGLLRNKGYLVIVTNNVFTKGRLFPLAYDTATSLTHDENHPWVLKDEKIWLQDDKALIALGVNSAWVGNRCHQFCLIFRKENDK